MPFACAAANMVNGTNITRQVKRTNTALKRALFIVFTPEWQ
jgi:hypothetical protein